MNQLKTVKSFARACGFVLSFLSTIFVFVSVSFADPNIAASSNSATCKNSTLETYSGTSNLSANWNANTINLHWYADDTATTELTGSGIPTSCVYDGALTPPPVASIPQKTGYTFAGWKVRGLPDEYTKLQYIQSSGTQYIDTGLKANKNTKMTLVYKFPEYTTSMLGYIVGCRDGQNTNAFLVGSHDAKITSSGKLFAQFDSVTPTVVKTKNIDLQKHTLTLSSAGFYVDNDLYISYSNSQNFTTSSNIVLFARYSEGSMAKGAIAVYSFKMWDNGTLVRNLIPAKNSSNVIGMYDTVTKTFFTNAGSGSFIAGPVVQ